MNTTTIEPDHSDNGLDFSDILNFTSLDLTDNSKPRGLISDEDAVTMESAIAYTMLVVSTVGLITNIISIRTFVMMGLKDGMAVSLLGLSISDLGLTIVGCTLSLSNLVASYEARNDIKNLPVQPRVFTVFAGNVCLVFYESTCMITTFLAVARCMCVALPFRFKNFFTRSRCIMALATIAVLAGVSYIPVLSQMGTQYKFDPRVNKSRVVLWLSNKRSDFKDMTSLIQFTVFGVFAAVIVFTCVLIMAKYLRESVKFRNSSTMKTGNEEKDKSGDKLSGKELQAVLQVMIISIIFTICLVPTLLYTIFRFVEDDFGVGKRLQNLYFNTSRLKVLLNITNSATTFPVYYFYNSRFRAMCFSRSGGEKKTEKRTVDRREQTGETATSHSRSTYVE